MHRKGLKTFFCVYFETSPFSLLEWYDSRFAVLGISSYQGGKLVRQQPWLVLSMLGTWVLQALLKFFMSTPSDFMISTHFGLKSAQETPCASLAIYVTCMSKAITSLLFLGFALPTGQNFLMSLQDGPSPGSAPWLWVITASDSTLTSMRHWGVAITQTITISCFKSSYWMRFV